MNNAENLGRSAGAAQPTLTPDEYKEMLAAICESQALFIEEPGRPAFYRLLDAALRLTGSECGFIAEVMRDADGSPYLKERAVRFADHKQQEAIDWLAQRI